MHELKFKGTTNINGANPRLDPRYFNGKDQATSRLRHRIQWCRKTKNCLVDIKVTARITLSHKELNGKGPFFLEALGFPLVYDVIYDVFADLFSKIFNLRINQRWVCYC